MFEAIKTFGSQIKNEFKNVTLSGSSNALTNFSLDTSFSSANYTRLVSLALKNPTARRSITFIARNLASIPLQLKRIDSDGGEEDIGEHEVLDLLRSPAGKDNPRYTKEWLFKGKVWALMGGGEYWLQGMSPSSGRNEGIPRKLHLYQRDDFSRFRTDNDGFIVGYDLQREMPYDTKTVNTTTEDTMHAFNYNPRNRFRGVPILLSVIRALDILEDADNWNKSISSNRGQVPGFFMPRGLEPGQTLDPESKEAAQSQVDESLNKGRERNSWRVLGGAYEPMENNMTPQEASFMEAMKWYSNMIAIGIGVDPIIAGDESAKTYDNFQTALVVSYTTTIIPLFEFMLSNLNRHLVPKFEDAEETLRLTYDPMTIDALREANLEKVESVVKATGGMPILSPDEGRGLMGKEPKELDDLVFKLNLQTGQELFGMSGMDIDTNMQSWDQIASKSEEELMDEVERVIKGKTYTDQHRNGNGKKKV